MSTSAIPPGGDPPGDINVIVEIPAGGSVKYEMNKAYGVLCVDRFLQSAMHYPANYGYIPGTLSVDGDPCDVMVVETPPLVPGSMIRCRPIGVLLMEDEAGRDEKILAVPVDQVQPRTAPIKHVDDLPPGVADQILDFFKHYKTLEKGKWAEAETFLGARDAETMIVQAIERANGEVPNHPPVRIEE